MKNHKHIIEAGQFEVCDIDSLFLTTDKMMRTNPRELLNVLRGKTLACIFYEPSTRTSSSFIAAMTKLGGGVIPITQGVQFSSVSKGETLEDTIVTLGQYADAIVLRHPELGSASRAAAVSPVPIVNAGDGVGEHPTQSLLDLYTIRNELGRIEDLNVCFVGDLANGRTVHSLIKLLTLYPNNKIHLVSPTSLGIEGRPLYEKVKRNIGEIFYVRNSLHEAKNILERSDVIYMTRVQKERFCDPEEYKEVKDSCVLDVDLVSCMKKTSRILHPLPRVNEIPTEIDKDPRAAYFRQVKSGLYVRMSLLIHTMHSLSIIYCHVN